MTSTGYHLVYSETVPLRDFTYKVNTHREGGEVWVDEFQPAPRGTVQIPYRLWLKEPGGRGVLVFDCPSTTVAFECFGRLMDLVRRVTVGVRPWRVFALVEQYPGKTLLFELAFHVLGDEYFFDDAKLVNARDLTGIVGDDQFKSSQVPKSQARRNSA